MSKGTPKKSAGLPLPRTLFVSQPNLNNKHVYARVFSTCATSEGRLCCNPHCVQVELSSALGEVLCTYGYSGVTYTLRDRFEEYCWLLQIMQCQDSGL